MYRLFLVSYLMISLEYPKASLGAIPPTKGEIWPKAQFENKTDTYFVYRPSKFHFKILNHSCDILISAINRIRVLYKNLLIIKNKYSLSYKKLSNESISDARILKKLKINLTSECELLPHIDMVESYNLTVSRTGLLTSSSIWGILRGLETFAQLFYFAPDYSNRKPLYISAPGELTTASDVCTQSLPRCIAYVAYVGQEVMINATHIIDFPQYKHRGLLIDTGRHYLRKETIFKIISSMAINKMNVLHWHIVDDESFPFQSELFPNISNNGAFAPSMIYTPADVVSIIDFARFRGIRVIPEFDLPGHTQSWGRWNPNLLTECYDMGLRIGLGSMNPLRNATFMMLKLFFQEVALKFPDKFVHIGGDEVNFECWESNPEIKRYMGEHRFTGYEVLKLFVQNTLSILPTNSIPIVWQEVFDSNATVKQTYVQVWKNNWIQSIIEILGAGHYVIFSSSWYLDNLISEWDTLYGIDPRQVIYGVTKNSSGLENIIGGEACLWSERVDDDNALSRIWPRASAVAERLWTGLDYKNTLTYNIVLNNALNRIEEHWCRMKRRGIPAQPPTGPGFCEYVHVSKF